MPFVVIVIGLIYFVDYVYREWTVPYPLENYSLVASYSNTAMFGLWIMFIGGVWLWLRKR